VSELEGDLRRMCRGGDPSITYQLDVRYVGQEFSLSVPVRREQIVAGDRVAIRAAFDKLHEHRYAHSAGYEPVEIINVRLVSAGRRAKPAMPLPATERVAPRKRMVVMGAGPSMDGSIYERAALVAGTIIDGPALIQEYGSTTVVFPQDRCEVARTGELVISVAA
jgi:N-methylhydantoinase A/oxoprolinase/acetone carboxylase beta subunit